MAKQTSILVRIGILLYFFMSTFIFLQDLTTTYGLTQCFYSLVSNKMDELNN